MTGLKSQWEKLSFLVLGCPDDTYTLKNLIGSQVEMYWNFKSLWMKLAMCCACQYELLKSPECKRVGEFKN